MTTFVVEPRQVVRDALGLVMAVRRGDMAGAQVLVERYAHPVMNGLLIGALINMIGEFLAEDAGQTGVDPDHMLAAMAAELAK